jgi:predicted alpha/beta hydrolase family esterase
MARAFTFLSIPGWQNSPAEHWQSLWERSSDGQIRRVVQRDWEQAERGEWVRGIEEAVAWTATPVVLIAHSLGVLAVAHWAAASVNAGRVAGAFLVTPPDLDCEQRRPQSLVSFAPVPSTRLPFPALVVGSETDPYATPERVARMAWDWGARHVNAGASGHINVTSGHGPWPEGERLFAAFLQEDLGAEFASIPVLA